MKRGLLLGSMLMVACGGKVGLPVDLGGEDAGVVDTGTVVDSGRRDTTPEPFDAEPPPFDTAPPPPTSCATPLPPGFTCAPPTPAKGQKVCTEDAIQAIVKGCFTGDGAGCDAARSKYPACEGCMLSDWLDASTLNVAACIVAVSGGTSPCAKSVKCGFDCLENVCSSCDPSPGTGSGGGSEMDDCYNDESYEGGACYAIAMKDYMACAEDPKLSVCFPYDVPQIVAFYRGACRDGGDFSKASSP